MSGRLLGKERINIGITFGQKYYGKKIYLSVSGALAEVAVTKIPGYELGFFSEGGNHPQLYSTHSTYREIFDASARSLHIEQLAKMMADDGDGVLDMAL